MIPVRKCMHHEFSFSLLLNYKVTKSPQRELPDHLHEWYEIVYIYRGKGAFFIDQTFYDMRQGDLMVIPGNTVHRAFPDKDEPMTSSAVFFNPNLIKNNAFDDAYNYLNLFSQAKKNKQYKYTLSPEHRRIIEQDIDALYSEWGQQRDCGSHAMSLQLHMALLHLNRHCLPQNTDSSISPTTGPDWFRHTLTYINEHLNQPLELCSLASRAAVSPAHLSRVFKQRIGMNVSDYITTKRIFAAKDLLLKSNDKIQHIANACGFESMPYFYRTFKKHTDVTPAAYRKRNRQ